MMKLNQRIKGAFLLTIFGIAISSAGAQDHFRYRASLKKVDSSGFYKIALQPSIVAISQAGLPDLRLVDSKGKYVAYINYSNIPVDKSQKFIAFPEIKPLTRTDTGTTIIIENKATSPISRLWLRLKNTAVVRTMNLAGSDDLKRWFAIEEGIPLEQSQTGNTGEYIQALTLPES